MSQPPPKAHPIYLDADGVEDPIFAFLHMSADDDERSKLAVLICPPFGWEDTCSYRARRAWAEHLAGSGCPVLRIDLPGTGDSGGAPRDPDRLSAWTDAVAHAAEHLRARTACEAVAAIGIGLGGLVACNAIAQGAAIDDVVLWGVPARGRSFTRELRAFAGLKGPDLDPTPPADLTQSPTRSGEIRAGGFFISAETTADLDALDLSTLTFRAGRPRRVLLLERDGIAVDPRLRAGFEETGATVAVGPGPGYGQMVSEPHLARAPRDTFDQVQAWLDAAPSTDVARAALAVPASMEAVAAGRSSSDLDLASQSAADLDTADQCTADLETASQSMADPDTTDQRAADLPVAGTRIRESPLTVAQSFGDLFAIVAEPIEIHPDGLCVVMLNAGAIRRVGPNRMWVESARRWAARGIPTVRLDVEGIGDADGDGERFGELAELYAPGLVDQVRDALDAFEARGLGRRFVLVGLCSGACWSFHGALRDERVIAAFMLNPRALIWDPTLETARGVRRGLLRPSSWRRILRGEVSQAEMGAFVRNAPAAFLRHAARRWRTRSAGEDELDRALDRLRDTGKHLLFVFSENEPLHEELEREGRLRQHDRWPNLELAVVPGRDHTLRPLSSQKRVHELLDRALDRELEAIRRT